MRRDNSKNKNEWDAGEGALSVPMHTAFSPAQGKGGRLVLQTRLNHPHASQIPKTVSSVCPALPLPPGLRGRSRSRSESTILVGVTVGVGVDKILPTPTPAL